jgi:hypothetical protein
VAWVECALSSLSTTRLTAPEQIDAVFLLFGHLRNNAVDTDRRHAAVERPRPDGPVAAKIQLKLFIFRCHAQDES